MTLVARVEERFNIKIPGEEITPENLDTCADIAAMIQRL
jgi:acyl carrier protein